MNVIHNHDGWPQDREIHDTAPNVVDSPLDGACDTSGNPIPISSLQYRYPVQPSRHDLTLQNITPNKINGQNLTSIGGDSARQENQEMLHKNAFAPNAAEIPLGGTTSNTSNLAPFRDSRDNLPLQNTRHLAHVQDPTLQKVTGQNLVTHTICRQHQVPNAAINQLGGASYISGTSTPLLDFSSKNSTVAIVMPPVVP